MSESQIQVRHQTVMDDEEILRQTLSKLLGYLGYEATFARDGDEAIQQFIQAREAGREFDAVILDLTVPGGMGGKAAIEKLLRIDPQVKAIVSSGYSDDPIMANFLEYGFSGVIAVLRITAGQDHLHPRF